MQNINWFTVLVIKLGLNEKKVRMQCSQPQCNNIYNKTYAWSCIGNDLTCQKWSEVKQNQASQSVSHEKRWEMSWKWNNNNHYYCHLPRRTRKPFLSYVRCHEEQGKSKSHTSTRQPQPQQKESIWTEFLKKRAELHFVFIILLPMHKIK